MNVIRPLKSRINNILKYKKPGVLLIVFLCIVLIAVSIALLINPNEEEGFGIASVTSQEIRDPKIAVKRGIKGYLEIFEEPNTPATLKINRGQNQDITLLLRFVSHDPELTEIQVTLDPSSGLGYGIEQYYVIKDVKGEIVERGSIIVSDLVKYNPSGTVTIKAGQTLPITMSVLMDIPDNLEKISFPLGGVGITADVPILNMVKVAAEND